MKSEPNKELTVELFVGHKRGVATDYDGDEHRNEWVKVDLPIADDEVVKSVRVYPKRAQSGEYVETREDCNALLVNGADIDRLVAKVMELFDALFTEPKQKEAFKKLVVRRIWDWYNTKSDYVNGEKRVFIDD